MQKTSSFCVNDIQLKDKKSGGFGRNLYHGNDLHQAYIVFSRTCEKMTEEEAKEATGGK